MTDSTPATAATLGWRCAFHNVAGRGDDDSLAEHENAEHDGLRIAVIVENRDYTQDLTDSAT